jgi:hypothetical protein
MLAIWEGGIGGRQDWRGAVRGLSIAVAEEGVHHQLALALAASGNSGRPG